MNNLKQMSAVVTTYSYDIPVVTLCANQEKAIAFIRKTMNYEFQQDIENGHDDSVLEELEDEIFGMRLTTYRFNGAVDTMTMVIAQDVMLDPAEKDCLDASDGRYAEEVFRTNDGSIKKIILRGTDYRIVLSRSDVSDILAYAFRSRKNDKWCSWIAAADEKSLPWKAGPECAFVNGNNLKLTVDGIEGNTAILTPEAFANGFSCWYRDGNDTHHAVRPDRFMIGFLSTDQADDILQYAVYGKKIY